VRTAALSGAHLPQAKANLSSRIAVGFRSANQLVAEAGLLDRSKCSFGSGEVGVVITRRITAVAVAAA